MNNVLRLRTQMPGEFQAQMYYLSTSGCCNSAFQLRYLLYQEA